MIGMLLSCAECVKLVITEIANGALHDIVGGARCVQLLRLV